MELLDSNEKLLEAQSQITKLQTCVDNAMKERVRSYCSMHVLCALTFHPFLVFL